VACGGSPLVDSTKRNVSRRNTTGTTKRFPTLEEISDHKKVVNLFPSVGNFNCSVICRVVEYVCVDVLILF
jgi:hypothetical protein